MSHYAHFNPNSTMHKPLAEECFCTISIVETYWKLSCWLAFVNHEHCHLNVLERLQWLQEVKKLYVSICFLIFKRLTYSLPIV
jgi:hypothetical protein